MGSSDTLGGNAPMPNPDIDLALLKRVCLEATTYFGGDSTGQLMLWVPFDIKISFQANEDRKKRMEAIAAKLCEMARERKADIGLMEQCRDVIASFIHDEDANVLPGAGLSTSDVLLLDEMFERLDEVIEGYRATLKRKAGRR